MVFDPKIGQRVQVVCDERCGAEYRYLLSLDRKIGTLRVVARSKSRTHGVEIDGRIYAVPRGNLRKVNKND